MDDAYELMTEEKEHLNDHFQKDWKPGTRIQPRAPPNDPIIERVPTVAPDFHCF